MVKEEVLRGDLEAIVHHLRFLVEAALQIEVSVFLLNPSTEMLN
jgi:hypothetical protein